MKLPKPILDELSQGVTHVAPLENTRPDHLAYVLIYGTKTSISLRPKRRYHVIWVEISNSLYQSYRKGNDIGWDDAEYFKDEWADTPEELEEILASKMVDFSQIVWTGMSKMPYPH